MNRSGLSLAQFFVLANQGFVHEPAPVRVLQHGLEAARIVILAGIEAEHLLVNVAVEMKASRSDIRPVNGALQARPKVFDVVRMDRSVDIFDGMIDVLVNVLGAEALVRAQRIGVDHRTRGHVRVDMREQVSRLLTRNEHGSNATLALLATLRHSENERLAFFAHGRLTDERPAPYVRPTLPTANKGFIRLNDASKHSAFNLHRFTNPMEHEPRRLLRDTERTTQLMRRGSVLGVRQEPNRRKPLGERNRAMLEDRVDLDRKLPMTVKATPLFAGGDKRHRSRAATHPRTGYAVRPSSLNAVRPSAFRVGKEGDRFDQGSRRLHGSIV